MSRNWPVSEAVHADSTGIASLFALSWTSPFSRLQFGDIDPLTLTTALAPRISQQIKARNLSFLVVHEPDTQNVVAVAQWTLPTEDPVTEETQDELDERQFLEDELYRKNLPVHSNKDLIMEFTVGLRALRTRLLRGRKHYLLDNLATHPDYRGRGLASHLIKWVLRAFWCILRLLAIIPQQVCTRDWVSKSGGVIRFKILVSLWREKSWRGVVVLLSIRM
jgi:GNAT superfamily N-acetyltransferase